VTANKLIDKMIGSKDKWYYLIESSFLPEDLKGKYRELIENRIARLTIR
jgi:hypothetical protein